ncbi:MAG: class I SAM-dependent methyltransferase [bacterium]
MYLLETLQDRSHGGQPLPRLVQGEAAPDWIPVAEHGTRLRATLGDQLSTGLFLDQRPQRAWLAQHAAGLRVLNTFAHAGVQRRRRPRRRAHRQPRPVSPGSPASRSSSPTTASIPPPTTASTATSSPGCPASPAAASGSIW